MVRSTGTPTTRIQRITAGIAGLGASAALALGLATPAHAADQHQAMTPRAATIQTAATGTPGAPKPGSSALPAAAAQARTAATAVPTAAQLMPEGKPSASQAAFHPSATQLANAKAIVKAGQEMHLPPRAWTIAVATAMQESKLINLGNLGAHNDHDSLGLFQQRTSTGGWGTAAQITDPDHAAKAFLTRLAEIPGWQKLPLTEAAQKVQVSAYPSAYAKWESAAAQVITQTFTS